MGVAPCTVRAFTATCALGAGLGAVEAALRSGRSALRPNTMPHTPHDTWVGEVDGLDDVRLPGAWARDGDCRATRLAWAGLQHDDFIAAVGACRQRWGAARVGVIIGTSASTIAASEEAYRRLDATGGFPADRRNPRLNTPHALAMFVGEALGLDGPALTVSTACSSSAKAFASAARWLQLGVVDAVVVGGVDALGASLLHGFRSLGLVSARPCRPFDAARSGLSVGEAAAYALLVRDDGGLRLLGCGESNDAHHMSSPHPQGLGADEALAAALGAARVTAEAVDLVLLHGTASAQNDEVEAALVARRYPPAVHASATKGLTGHTMGAAGALQAVFALLALQRGVCPGSGPTETVDPALGEAFARQWQARPVPRAVRVAASHSFGFGGTNAVLVFGQNAAAGATR